MSQGLLRASIALCLGLGGVGAAVDPAPAAAPIPTTTVEEAPPAATVTVAPEASGTFGPDQDLRVSVVVTNTGTEALSDGSVRLVLGDDRLESSEDAGAWLIPRENAELPIGARLGDEDAPALSRGERARSIGFTIPADQLEFLADRPWGAYPLWVEYRADGADTVIGRSSVVWTPGDAPSQAGIAATVPLTVPTTQTGLLAGEDLERYTSTSGLLTRQLDAVEGGEVAIGLDPMILASIRALGSAAPESALDWLVRLDALENEVFPLAYADMDLAAVSQAGGGVPVPQNFDFALDPALFPAPDPQAAPEETATPGPPAPPSAPPTPDPSAAPTPTASPVPGGSDVPTTEELLAWDYTLDGIAWPAEGTVTEGDLDVFAAGGLTTTILADGNLRPGTGSAEAHVSVAEHSALTADFLLSTLLRDAVSARTSEEWQSALSGIGTALAVVATEHDGTPPVSLAALDRSRPSSQPRLGATIAALDRLDWVDSSTLTEVLDRPARPARLVNRPVGDDRLEVIRGILAAAAEEAEFATIAEDPTDITAPRRLRALALLSQSWRGAPNAWTEQLGEFVAESQALRGSVQLVQSSDLNINNELQRLPVSIANDLDVPVTVLVDVRSLSPELRIEESPVQVVVEPNSAVREFVIPVHPLANGQATILMSLSTPTREPIGGVTRLTLNVQADWGTPVAVGLGVVVVGLIAAGLYRTSRRKRRGRDPGVTDG